MQVKELRTHLLAKYQHPLTTVQWKPEHIPAELRQLKQWRQCYRFGTDLYGETISTPKRPIGGATITDKYKGESLSNLITTDPDLHWGLCITDNDEIIGLDVDKLPENFTIDDVPVALRKILQAFPTYVEISPSGQGLHAFYRTNKTLFKHRPAQDKSIDGFEGTAFIRDQFMTFTGHTYLPLSKPGQSIHAIDATLFEKLIFQPSKVSLAPSVPSAPSTSIDRGVPTIEDLTRWLSLIPPSLSNHPARERYYEIYRTFSPPTESPSDYDHWRIIAAALHHGFASNGSAQLGEEIFDEWSSHDDKYEGREKTIRKYHDNAPTFTDKDITSFTLAKLAQASIPRWPYPEMDKKGRPTNKPIPTNVINFEAMLRHLNLTLTQNEITKEIFATGNEVIQSKYFPKAMTRKTLEANTLRLCHDTYFQRIGMSTASAFAQALVSREMTQFNPIKQWIDSTPPGPPGQFDRLFSTLVIPAHEQGSLPLYRTYLKKNLMGIIRAHYYHGRKAATTGMVILSGPENSFKTTWITHLLPAEFRNYVLPSQKALSKAETREIQYELSTCQIWLRDEVEQLLQGGDAPLKNLLVQEVDAYRPIYSDPIVVPRKCIFFGTTNRRELPITDDGSRRIQVIPVELCQIDILDTIDMALVYKELLLEFEATPVDKQFTLWALTRDEIAQTNQINFESRKLDQEADLYLKEVFNFDHPFNLHDYITRSGKLHKPSLITYTTVHRVLMDMLGPGVSKISANALKRALQRQCGQWTGTYAIPHTSNLAQIDQGWGIQKKAGSNVNEYSGWLLPPRRTNILTQAEQAEKTISQEKQNAK